MLSRIAAQCFMLLALGCRAGQGTRTEHTGLRRQLSIVCRGPRTRIRKVVASHSATQRRNASIVLETVRDASPTPPFQEVLHKDLLALEHYDTVHTTSFMSYGRMRAPRPASLPEAEHELIPHPRSPPAEMTYVSAFNASCHP